MGSHNGRRSPEDDHRTPSGDVTTATVGVIGGSGLYELLDGAERVDIDTPYGRPSAPVSVGFVQGDADRRQVAFLPRHGPQHELAPHRINYRANLWALRELGVQRVLAPCASGSLTPEIGPGELVVCDQFVDRTSGRAATFFDGPVVNHVSVADPYCPQAGAAVAAAGRAHGFTVHERGTAVVIEGPRFSTRAEAAWFRAAGWHVVNMTQYPEVVLARELGMCYTALAIVTDHDVGIEGTAGSAPVTQDEVFARFAACLPRVRATLHGAVLQMPAERTCGCAAAANGVEPVPEWAREPTPVTSSRAR